MPEDIDASRKLRRKERRYYTDEGVDEDEIDGRRNFSIDDKLRCTRYEVDFVTELKGADVNLRYFQENGFKRPIIVKDKTGLGMRVPSKNFTVNDVKQCVGSRRPLDVMDVNTQKALAMTMKEWTKYYENKNRDRLLNVISLEFSHTKLENYVEQPTVVRQIDWIDAMWPRFLKESQSESTNVLDKMKYPKVQKYCLMSVKGCYTDFHIDMGGTSVWYHILHGKKIFWLVPPTEANLRMYEDWTLSGKQGDVFFADKVKDCQRVVLEAGFTFFIPTGWIHAVYTPEDSLVFGGNFLHMFNVPMQLRIWEVEGRTHVPSKFRYPFFTEIHWYVLERYITCVTGKQHRTRSVMELQAEDEEGPLARAETDSKSEASSGRSEDRAREFSPPRSPFEEDHCYSSSRSSTPISPRVPLHDDNVPCHQSMESCTPQPLRASQNSPRPKESPPSSEERIKMSPSDLISPVSVKLENCMASVVDKAEFMDSIKHYETSQREVHLTTWEVEGLEAIISWLEMLPVVKRQVPKDILDPSGLINDAKRLIIKHEHDDPKLALTGEPVVKWPYRKKKDKSRYTALFPKSPNLPKSTTPKGPKKLQSGAGRRRRVRCKRCEPCTRDDCRECVYCKDMKKFGGPGKLKQTCIGRQCIVPVLAHTLVCNICAVDETENHKKGTVTMMECGICWEIVHSPCLRKKHEELTSEGVINEDLPNSWECPKCVDNGKQGQLKPQKQLRGTRGGGEPIKNSSSPTSDIIKDDGDFENKDVNSPECRDEEADEEEEAEEDALESNGHTPVKAQNPSPPKRGRPRKHPIVEPTSHSPKKVKIEPGVKLEPVVKIEPMESPPSPRRTRTSSTTPVAAVKEEPAFRTSPPVLPLSPLSPKTVQYGNGAKTTSRGRETGSDDETTKQKGPPKGSGSRSRSRSPRPGPSGAGGGDDGDGDGGSGGGRQSPGGKRPHDPSPPSHHGNIPLKQCKVVVHKYVVRPAPVAAPARFCETTPEHGVRLGRELWIRILNYLSVPHRSQCMGVCKTWYRWCLDPRLWYTLDLSRRRVKQRHLVGIVTRQPHNLNLSWTNFSREQMVWLIARLPHLKYFNLAGNSWPGVSALASSSCPLLHSLNLNWVTGVYDNCVRDLVSPPIDHKPGVDDSVGRLHQCLELCIAGADITDDIMEVIVRNVPNLNKLDLSYCSKITNTGLRLLCCGKGNRLDLHELDLTGCHHLTDQCFQFLTFVRNLKKLSLQACPNITLEGCQHYIQHAPNRCLQMASDRLFETV